MILRLRFLLWLAFYLVVYVIVCVFTIFADGLKAAWNSAVEGAWQRAAGQKPTMRPWRAVDSEMRREKHPSNN